MFAKTRSDYGTVEEKQPIYLQNRFLSQSRQIGGIAIMAANFFIRGDSAFLELMRLHVYDSAEQQDQ
jgi:hypothetical protein